MRKLLLLLIISLFVTGSIFAFTDNFGNYRYDVNHNELVASLKNAEDEKTVLANYDKFMASNSDNAMKVRIEFYMVTYYINEHDDKKSAELHYERAQEFYSTLTEDNEKKTVAEYELASCKYMITKKQMSDGLKVSNLTKDAFKKYPGEITIILMEASRYQNTPKFAGGSPKKAIEMLVTMLPVESQMQDIDRYVLYSNLGLAYKDNKDKIKAKEYITKALEIYNGDIILKEALKEL